MIPASHHGSFAGTNHLWFRPGTPAHVSDGVLEAGSDRVAIRWAHDGKPHQGEVVLSGPGPACRGDYTDSFHAGSGMTLHGHTLGRTVRLYGTYSAGDGSPAWGWRIELDWTTPDELRFRMYNVLPDGAEALAVDLRGSR